MKSEDLMKQALEEAQKALGQTSPNPLVGAVIVKNSMLVATGHHARPGADHAELAAIKKAKEQGIDLQGATLYCNLEPCCHLEKRTAPCAQRIIKEGFKEVFISHLDPNPEVSGKGVSLLEEAGIKVHTGILEQEAKRLNEAFIINMEKKRPMVHLKWAQSLDGYMAQEDGHSQWITGELARTDVHYERMKCDAILVGANTLRVDNPSLTIRLCSNPNEKVPKRLVLSQSGDLPLNSKLFSNSYRDQTIVIVPEEVQTSNLQQLQERGITLYRVPSLQGKMDLKAMIYGLRHLGIYSVLIEGGPNVMSQFFSQGLFDRVSAYISPKTLGQGIKALSGFSLAIEHALKLSNIEWQQFGQDMKMTALPIQEP